MQHNVDEKDVIIIIASINLGTKKVPQGACILATVKNTFRLQFRGIGQYENTYFLLKTFSIAFIISIVYLISRKALNSKLYSYSYMCFKNVKLKSELSTNLCLKLGVG